MRLPKIKPGDRISVMDNRSDQICTATVESVDPDGDTLIVVFSKPWTGRHIKRAKVRLDSGVIQEVLG